MLKRLRVGGRLNLLILVPLVAIAALGVLAYQSLVRASLEGQEFKRLEQATALRADVLPPPASLLESWMLANRIVNAIPVDSTGMDNEARSNVTVLLTRFNLSEQAYRLAYDKWWDTADLDAEVRLRLLGYGGYEADQFYAVGEQLLVPAAQRLDLAQVRTAVELMAPHFEAQNRQVTNVVTWSEQRIFDATQDNQGLVDRVLRVLIGAVIGLAALTFALAYLVRRSIVRPIKALSNRANAVASTELPLAVAAVQAAPQNAIKPSLPRFETRSRDELADLARSFTSVQDTALELASEQATARRVVSENLVNIARRSQSLLGRTLGFISNLEETERSPEALDNLFRIDHLTTRMRRNAQSLLVLAGAEPNRLFAPPVPLGDVVRAALSEVENYGRIDLGDLGGAYVTGALAPEIAHLLAELLENATTFSPPSTRVQVLGRRTNDGHQLVIVDHGIGLTADELRRANERLASVDDFDRESSKVLGFQVVARLASRHGIRVVLTPTPNGSGVTAVVFLPSRIIEQAPGANLAPSPLAIPVPAKPAEAVSAAAPVLVERPASEMSSEELWEMFADPSPADVSPAATSPIVQSPAVQSVDEPIAPADVDVAPSAAPLWDPAPVETPPAVALAPSLPATTTAGLAKRVRGAQMPQVADGFGATDDVPRPAEQVRSTLASLQRGVQLGRRSTDAFGAESFSIPADGTTEER